MRMSLMTFVLNAENLRANKLSKKVHSPVECLVVRCPSAHRQAQDYNSSTVAATLMESCGGFVRSLFVEDHCI